MVLNATNREILKRTFGDDTDLTIGKQIVVYVDPNISYAGKIIGGIRMRAPKTVPGRKPVPPPVPEPEPQREAGEDEFDNDIPF
jgi:hypothetical protein